MSLLETLTEHFEAVVERDIDRFAATLASDDVRFIGGDGTIVEGRDNVIATHRDWFMSDEWQFDPEIVATREGTDVGHALARVRYRERGNDKQFWLSFLLAIEDGEWKVVSDQNTPIPTSDLQSREAAT